MKYNLPKNITFDKQIIQSRMQETRLLRDYSYRDLETLTGISKTTLRKMETDLPDIVPLIYLQSVAKALSVDFLWLIGNK